MQRLTMQQIQDADLTDWRKLAHGLHARFATDGFTNGLDFVNAIGAAAETADHHPDITLTWPTVDIVLVTHSEGGVTQADVDLARSISDIARQQGIASKLTVTAELELSLDTADASAVGPFWAALLTGTADAYDGDEVRDPAGQVPALWFQQTDPHETPRQRFHIDLWIPPEILQQRIDAAVAAGGVVVDDSQTPRFVVLADADGNRACLCTSLTRTHG